jgi:hypothetical protein
MAIGNDPALWRYASLQAALEASTDLVADLIRAGQAQALNEAELSETESA